MTDTAASAVSARPRLERPREGRTILGVCAALGRYTDVDPVIYRVILIALTIFGGFGAALYGIGWLLIPEEGERDSVLDRVAHRHVHRLRTPIGVVVAVAAIILLALVTAGSTRNVAVTVLLLALVGYLLLRRPDGHATAAAVSPATPAPAAASTATAAAAATAAGPVTADFSATTDTAVLTPAADAATDAPVEPPRSWAPPPYVPPPPRAPRPPRSRLGLITLSAALVVSGILVALREAGVNELTVPRILAVALGVVAAGLIVGAWYGKAKWLAIPGTMLAIVTVIAASISVPFDGGIGNRHWTPTTATALQPTYHLGIGNAELDLTALGNDAAGFPAETTVTATVGTGRLEVIVPRGVTVDVSGHADAGDVYLFTRQDSGIDAHLDAVRSPAGATQVLHLDTRIGFGQIRVHTGGPVASQA